VLRRATRLDSLTPVPGPRRRNPWTSTGEVLIWVLFAALLFPAGFAGWAVGHYTSLGGSKSTGARSPSREGRPPPRRRRRRRHLRRLPPRRAAAAATATAGKALFASNGCATCHTFQPAGSTGTLGPNLDTAPTSTRRPDKNMALAAFVKESIVNPDAYIAKGFNKGLMPKTFGSSIKGADLNDLVAFLLSGTKS
jgi:Cytochrome c551/c552